tara:strand:+ start:175 stop:528 length:354 start_codon:yes stop_codon:yes gene_type:complete
MELHIEGTLKKKFDVVTRKNDFKSMEFIVKTEDDNYPQLIKIQALKTNIEKVIDLPEGTKAKWHCNLKGRAWENAEGKTIYFNSIEVWRVEIIGTDLKEEPKEEVTTTNDSGDELPF